MNETGNEAGKITEGLPRDMIPALIARRLKVGATSPIGRRISTVVEQLENGVSPLQTLREIEQIQRDGGRYVHEHHGVGFFASLTEEQQKAALAYDGPENHGDPAFANHMKGEA